MYLSKMLFEYIYSNLEHATEIQLHIRENTKGEICVSNSIEETVGSAKEMLACLVGIVSFRCLNVSQLMFFNL